MNKVIKFKNDHGLFSLKRGGCYDFDLVDRQSGEVFPHSKIQVLASTKAEIKTIDESNRVVSIKKETVCNVKELLEKGLSHGNV